MSSSGNGASQVQLMTNQPRGQKSWAHQVSKEAGKVDKKKKKTCIRRGGNIGQTTKGLGDLQNES